MVGIGGLTLLLVDRLAPAQFIPPLPHSLTFDPLFSYLTVFVFIFIFGSLVYLIWFVFVSFG